MGGVHLDGRAVGAGGIVDVFEQGFAAGAAFGEFVGVDVVGEGVEGGEVILPVIHDFAEGKDGAFHVALGHASDKDDEFELIERAEISGFEPDGVLEFGDLGPVKLEVGEMEPEALMSGEGSGAVAVVREPAAEETKMLEDAFAQGAVLRGQEIECFHGVQSCKGANGSEEGRSREFGWGAAITV